MNKLYCTFNCYMWLKLIFLILAYDTELESRYNGWDLKGKIQLSVWIKALVVEWNQKKKIPMLLNGCRKMYQCCMVCMVYMYGIPSVRVWLGLCLWLILLLVFLCACGVTGNVCDRWTFLIGIFPWRQRTNAEWH